MKFIYISVGGAIGAVTRFWLGSQFSETNLAGGDFPLATFSINLVGSLLLGFLSMYFYQTRGNFYAAMTTGFLGGFTTFSAFSLEAFTLLTGGFSNMAFLYVGESVLGGILCALIGGFIAEKLSK